MTSHSGKHLYKTTLNTESVLTSSLLVLAHAPGQSLLHLLYTWRLLSAVKQLGRPGLLMQAAAAAAALCLQPVQTTTEVATAWVENKMEN